jgi:hypothetical protein
MIGHPTDSEGIRPSDAFFYVPKALERVGGPGFLPRHGVQRRISKVKIK